MQQHPRIAFCSCGRTGPVPSLCQCGQQLVDNNPAVRIAIANTANMVPPPPPTMQQQPNQGPIGPQFSWGPRAEAYNFSHAANKLYEGRQVQMQYQNQQQPQYQHPQYNRRQRRRDTDQSRVKCASCPYMKRINHHPQCWECHKAGTPLPNPNGNIAHQPPQRVAPPSPCHSSGPNVIELWEQQLQHAAENLDPRSGNDNNHGTAPMDVEEPPNRQPSVDSRQSRKSRSMSRASSNHDRQYSVSPTRSMRRTPPTSPYPSGNVGLNPFDGAARVAVKDVFTSRSPSPMPFQSPSRTVNASMFGIDPQVKERAQQLFENARDPSDGFPTKTHGGFEYQKERIYVPKQLTPKMKEQSNWICNMTGVKFLDLGQLPQSIVEDRAQLQSYMWSLGNAFSDLEMLAALSTFVKGALAKHIKQVQGHLTALAEKQAADNMSTPVQPQPPTPTQTIIDLLQQHLSAANPETKEVCMNVVKLLQDMKSQSVINSAMSNQASVSSFQPSQLSVPPGQETQSCVPPTPNVPVWPAPLTPSGAPITVASSSFNTPQGTTPSPPKEATMRGTPNANVDKSVRDQIEATTRLAAQTAINSDSSLSPVIEDDPLNASTSSTQSEVPYVEDLESVYQKVANGDRRNTLVQKAKAMQIWGNSGEEDAESQTPMLTEEQWNRCASENDMLEKSPKSKRARKEKALQKEREKQEKVNRKPAGSPPHPTPSSSSALSKAKSKTKRNQVKR